MSNRLIPAAEIAADIGEQLRKAVEPLNDADKRKFYEAVVRYIQGRQGFPITSTTGGAE
jgi:hypothetical protein